MKWKGKKTFLYDIYICINKSWFHAGSIVDICLLWISAELDADIYNAK